MNILSSVASEDFNTQREQWENYLKTELRLPDVSTKVGRKSLDGGPWPVLSLSSPSSVQLGVKESWKKASQTYASFSGSLEGDLREDLSHGVRCFFFFKEGLTEESWRVICGVFKSFSSVADIDVFLLGSRNFATGQTNFCVVDESAMVTGRSAHDQGGTSVQELALMTVNLIQTVETPGRVTLGVFTDSRFFRNIAKLRAARLLALKVLEESRVKRDVHLVALSSYREWTLYERYSNMLRNDAAVASAYIGGADTVQSSGYNVLFEISGTPEGDHHERSRRMGRNTAHILALESMLGVVQDAAFGSYHLESLTGFYAQEAWAEMQRLLAGSGSEITPVREQRLKEFRSRKHVLAGTNDFPDAKEKLSLGSIPAFSFFRLAEGFEALRLRMENLPKAPSVTIGVLGDYAALNARLNFVKNYFQLLGLVVREVQSIEELKVEAGIAVLCALDEDYPKYEGVKLAARDKFIAGKVELSGFSNLFAGQDVFAVLEEIAGRWSNV